MTANSNTRSGRLLALVAAIALGAAAPARAAPRGAKASSRVEKGIGRAAANVLRAPDKAWRAVLRVTAALKAHARALKSGRTIVGYPMRGPLALLAKDKAARIGALVLDDASHHFGLARRCANRRFHGARFVRGGVRVELVVGTPCDQLFIAFKPKGVKAGASLWGVVMRKAAAAKLRRLLGAR